MKLLAEINNSSQTAFPTDTTLDFGNFWNAGVNTRNISLVYNTMPRRDEALSVLRGSI